MLYSRLFEQSSNFESNSTFLKILQSTLKFVSINQSICLCIHFHTVLLFNIVFHSYTVVSLWQASHCPSQGSSHFFFDHFRSEKRPYNGVYVSFLNYTVCIVNQYFTATSTNKTLQQKNSYWHVQSFEKYNNFFILKQLWNHEMK